MACVSPCLCGVTLVGTEDPLNKLIHLVLKEPGCVLGPVELGVEREGACLVDLLVQCQPATPTTK